MRNPGAKFSVQWARKKVKVTRSRSPSLLLFFVILILLSIVPGATALDVGSVAPDFELRSLDGQAVKLSDYRGSPVLLKMATTWCPTCKTQVKTIDSLASQLVDQDVALVEVFVGESEDEVQRSMVGREFPFRHVALLDPDGDVFNGLYQGYVVPRVLVLDVNGRVHHDGTLIAGEPLRHKLNELSASRIKAADRHRGKK